MPASTTAADIETIVRRASSGAEPRQFIRSEDGLFVAGTDFIAWNEGRPDAVKEPQADRIAAAERHRLSGCEYECTVEPSDGYQAVESLLTTQARRVPMFHRIWRQWQRSIVEAVWPNGLRGGKRARLRSVRPRLEVLEERALPSTLGDVFYIDMENHNLTQPSSVTSPQQLLLNSAAPYLNSLITPGSTNPAEAQTSYASNYLNSGPGIHPSEPNYIWQEGGSNFGVVNGDPGNIPDADPYANNGNPNPNLNTNVKLVAATGNNPANLSALLQAQYSTAGWHAYQEDMQYTGLSVPTVSASGTIPGGGTNLYNSSTLYSYAPKHDGTLFYPATNGGTLNGPGPADSSNTEAAYYSPLGQLATDLTNNTVAKYNLITPDLYNDMHTPFPAPTGNNPPMTFTYHGVTYQPNTDQQAVALGDNFLSIIIPQIMASQAYKNNGAIVIWFDETEGGDSSAFTLAEIVISPLAKGNAYDSTIPLNHSSDLKSMQELFGVSAPGGGFLGNANSNAPSTSDLGDLFQPGALTATVTAPVAVAIPGAGVWRYEDPTGWRQLSPANASLVSVDSSGNVAVEIPGSGVWRWEDATGWAQLTTADASQVSIANGIVAVEIPGAGVWRYKDATKWQQLTTANASRVDVDASGDVAAEIPGAGVWRWEDATAWAQLTTADASQVSIANGIVAVEINGSGVWRYEDATKWQQLTTANASRVDVDGSGDVAAAIPGAGVWRWEDATLWAQLSTTDASLAAIDASGNVAVDIPGVGVRRWNGNAGWEQLTPVDASALDA